MGTYPKNLGGITMKYLLRRVAAIGVALALTGATLPAFAMTAHASSGPMVGQGPLDAEGSTPITVQLDGQNITFTDAVPQVRNWRTFLPFRAVFEAMGAEVSYDGFDITAVRGDRTVTMRVDSTEATVTENGKTTTITMDASPYLDNTTWRTYVPVRFAAQALGGAVGWDQEAWTAVIVDTGKLVDNALEGKSFTYLEKLIKYSKKYNEGIWNSEMNMDGTMSVDLSTLGLEMPALTASAQVTAKGITQDETKAQADMKMTADLTQLGSVLSGLILSQSADSESANQDLAQLTAFLNALAKEGIGCSIRGDLSTGKFYLNMDLSSLPDFAAVTSALGGPSFDADTWYSMDMNAVLAQAGSDVDLPGLLEQTKNVDYAALVKSVLQSADVNSAETGYSTVKAAVDAAVLALSDTGFTKSGNTAATSKAIDLGDGSSLSFVLSLTMKDDAVAGYDLDFLVSSTGDMGTTAMGMKMSMDEKDQLTGSITMNVVDFVSIDLSITGGYTKGTTAPVTEPPAGATVADYFSLLSGLIPNQQ